MIQVPVKLLAFDEFMPATLTFVGNAPCVIVFRRVYMPGELPADAKIVVPTADEVAAAERASLQRLIEAARREGFELVDEAEVRYPTQR